MADRFRAENDDYNAIMAEAIADRLAEAFAECLHKRVRDEWGYGRAEGLSPAESDPGKVSRHSPGAGVSGVSRSHGEGNDLAFARCEGEDRDRITESFAMWPGSSVSGLYFAHPRVALLSAWARSIATRWRITRERKGMSVAEVERWLGPNLNYEPGA